MANTTVIPDQRIGTAQAEQLARQQRSPWADAMLRLGNGALFTAAGTAFGVAGSVIGTLAFGQTVITGASTALSGTATAFLMKVGAAVGIGAIAGDGVMQAADAAVKVAPMLPIAFTASTALSGALLSVPFSDWEIGRKTKQQAALIREEHNMKAAAAAAKKQAKAQLPQLIQAADAQAAELGLLPSGTQGRGLFQGNPLAVS